VTDRVVMSHHYPLLVPGAVNLVGIDPGIGYRIQVSNQMAHLVESANSKFEEQEGSAAEGPTSGVDAKRVPVDDMLRAMQGDIASLSNFVAVINGKQESEDWPARRVVWPAEKLQKALDGDKELEAQLVRDINVNLDGTPIDVVRKNSIYDGIIVDIPVPVRVSIGDEVKTQVARLQIPFRPRIAHAVEADLKNKETITPEMLAGYYTQEAKKALENPGGREDVGRTIRTMIDPKEAAQYAAAPERLLRSARVIVNDSCVTGASFEEFEGPQGRKLYDMNISLTNEGRMRLWQYSKRAPHTQLLLTVDGTPIAAPWVKRELAQSELTITQLPDQTLVQDTVDAINARSRAK
jgi:hypothetical protein